MGVNAKREDAPHQEEMMWTFRKHRAFISHAPASIVVASDVRGARLTLEARLCQKWHSKRRLFRQRASHLFFFWLIQPSIGITQGMGMAPLRDIC